MPPQIEGIIVDKEKEKSRPLSPQAHPLYWESTEAKKLFAPIDDEVNAYDAVLNQICTLSEALESHDGYLKVLSNKSKITDGSISRYHVWCLTQKIRTLVIALSFAEKFMPSLQNWNSCCTRAIEELSKTPGLKSITCSFTVAKWYREFRSNGHKLSGTAFETGSKISLPPFLSNNPDVCSKVRKYAHENLVTLSVELISEYLHDVILPKMVMDKYGISEKDETYESKKKAILITNGLTKLCPVTVYRYLVLLGFKYKTRMKGYYVDGHERPATILYRDKFNKRYLELERRMFRLIYISKEHRKLEENNY